MSLFPMMMMSSLVRLYLRTPFLNSLKFFWHFSRKLFFDTVFENPFLYFLCVQERFEFFLSFFVTLVGNFFCGFLIAIKIRSHATPCSLYLLLWGKVNSFFQPFLVREQFNKELLFLSCRHIQYFHFCP